MNEKEILEGNKLIAEIEGFNGKYSVSAEGFVINNDKKRILPMFDNSHGYLYVTLNGKNYYVHRLVALVFIPNPEGKKTVNHIDCDKKNNKLSNLEWNTYRENVVNYFKHPKSLTRPSKIYGSKKFTMIEKKEKPWRIKKLSVSDVAEIRETGNGRSYAETGRKYGVSATLISNIVRRRIWKNRLA